MKGIIHAREYFSIEQQNEILNSIDICSKTTPFYTPLYKGEWKMNLQILCLGYHWNPQTCEYQTKRWDVDELDVTPIPKPLWDIAREACIDKWGSAPLFDVCIINKYEFPSGKLGRHQDKDEDEVLLATGSPVLSISIGEDAVFYASNKKSKVDFRENLKSGDLLIFGGESRLCYHGIERLIPNTKPASVNCKKFERVNLTFRQCCI